MEHRSEDFVWMEECNGQLYAPTHTKRKVRSKKYEFVGWGSNLLIEFLQSIGKDTTDKLSQYDVTSIINDYVKENNLINPVKKKRVLCDEKLLYLFGRKTVNRVKIHDLLEPHFAENQDEDDFSNSSEEDYEAYKKQRASTSDRKVYQKKKFLETSKNYAEFPAIVPGNINLVYLRRSLVQDLLKDSETLERKVVGSFVRIKSDPNDYSQKNPYQLEQVRGIVKPSGTDAASTEILLQVSGVIKDIPISMLSDENFTEEECNDLLQRMKDGLIKKPTFVELEEKACILHEDITKHWLVREIGLLQNLIDRANEKGWRRELFDHLERRQLLQTPSEQSRLLRELPKVIPEKIEPEAKPQDLPSPDQEYDDSPRSILSGASENQTYNLATNSSTKTQVLATADAPGKRDTIMATKVTVDSPLGRQGNWDFTKGIVSGTNIEGNGAVVFNSTSITCESSLGIIGNWDFAKGAMCGEQVIEGIQDALPVSKQDSVQVAWPMAKQDSVQVALPMAKQCSVEVVLPMAKQDTVQVAWPMAKQDSVQVALPMAKQDIKTEECRGVSIDEEEKQQSVMNGLVVEDKHVIQSVTKPQVIELSDSDEDEDEGAVQVVEDHPESLVWLYMDPQGEIQGPFSMASLKRWSDANYFPPNFMVWKQLQRPDQAVLLKDVLDRMFPN